MTSDREQFKKHGIVEELTVGVPVWNSVKTISRCLNAIGANGSCNARILVVDNASDDRTDQVAAEMLKASPASSVVHNPANLGRVQNWNRCLELCTSRYLKFALSNDVLMGGSLQCLKDVAHEYPDAVMICSRSRDVLEMPEEIPKVEQSPSVVYRTPSETYRYFATEGCRTGGLNGMLIDVHAVRRAGLQFRTDMPYCADYYFAIELAGLGPTVFIDADTYLFDAGAKGRFHFVGLNDTRSFLRQQRECAQKLCELIGDAAIAHRYLAGQFRWLLGEGARIGLRDAWTTFSRAPVSMRMDAIWTTCVVNLRRNSFLSPAH